MQQRGWDQILPGHSRAKFGPILSAVTSSGNQAEKIGPNFARPLTGKNFVQSFLLSVPTGNQGNDGREGWIKFCRRTVPGTLVASRSLLP